MAIDEQIDDTIRSLAYEAMELGVDNCKRGYTYEEIDKLLPQAIIAIKKLLLEAKAGENHRINNYCEATFNKPDFKYNLRNYVDERIDQLTKEANSL